MLRSERLRKKREGYGSDCFGLASNCYADTDRVRTRPTRPDHCNGIAACRSVLHRGDCEDHGTTAAGNDSYTVGGKACCGTVMDTGCYAR
jgi:hypothetical protein